VIDHDLIPESDPGMWARVTTFESQSREQVEDALRRVVDDVVPELRELPGWRGALALATENRSRAIVVTFWDSVEALVSGGRTARELRRPDGSPGTSVVTGIERLEIVLDERVEQRR